MEHSAKILGSEVDSKEKKESSNAGRGKREGRTIYASNTLINLINAQDGINEQEGNFPKIINRAGWNKGAGNLKP